MSRTEVSWHVSAGPWLGAMPAPKKLISAQDAHIFEMSFLAKDEPLGESGTMR